jgi:hypothetical protein
MGRSTLAAQRSFRVSPHAPVGVVSQFFYRGTGRGEQFRGDYQKLYDDGIQVALKYLGE